MFRRETNREFAQGLEIDRLSNKIGNVAHDAMLARSDANAEASRADASLTVASMIADGLKNAVGNVNRLKALVAEKDTALGKWVRHSAELEAQIARLKDELAISEATSEARSAQSATLRSIIPADSDILSDSGQRYADGRIKTKLRIIWERTFDATASKLGIANPSSRRVN